MAAARHIFHNGAHKAVTDTGRKTVLPNGNPAGDRGVTNKTPGSTSVVTGK